MMNYWVIRVRENGILVEEPSYKDWEAAQRKSAEPKGGYPWSVVFPSFSSDKEEVAREYLEEREQDYGKPGFDLYGGLK